MIAKPDMTRCTVCRGKLTQDAIGPYCPLCCKRHTYDYQGTPKTNWLSRFIKKFRHRRRARLRREAKRKFKRLYGARNIAFSWKLMGRVDSPKDIFAWHYLVPSNFCLQRRCVVCNEWEFNNGRGWLHGGRRRGKLPAHMIRE